MSKQLNLPLDVKGDITICALASGSNGNCYYIGNETDAILVDAGITTKKILKRMKDRNLDPQKLRAIFITHEHGDHVKGTRVLSKKLDIPAYFSPKTLEALYYTYRPEAAWTFEPGEKVEIGPFLIHPFLKNHDGVEPCSFRVEYNNKHIGVFTDIGTPCENLIENLKQCNAIFLETNYDERMLEDGPYPIFLKRRVASDVGHLSNKQAYELLEEHAGEKLQCVYLSHLSGENNAPEIAYELLQPFEPKFEVRLTSRYEAGEVYVV